MAQLPRVASSDSESEVDRSLVAAANGHSKLHDGNANGKRPLMASDSEGSDDDKPLAKRPRQSTVASSASPAPPTKDRGRKRKAAAVSSESSDNDAPLAQTVRSVAVPMPGAIKDRTDDGDTTLAETVNGRTPRRLSAKTYKEESDSEDDIPLTKVKQKKSPPTKAKDKKPAKKKIKREASDEEPEEEPSSDDDKPLAQKSTGAKKAKAVSKPAAATKKTNGASAKKVKEESASPAKAKQKAKKEKEAEEDAKEEEQEELYKWWEQQAQGDGSEKWQTLEHNGVLFPPPYVPLPANVKMLYDGKPVTLPHESEEVAGFFGAMLETTHAQDATFRKNFFEDFQTILQKYPPIGNVKIKSLDKCDFRAMYEHFEAERAKKKALSSAEKKALKQEKDAMEEPYLYCLLDGRKEKVGNFRAEPPGLFRGRGEHPKKGKLKFRIGPEDLTLNIGEDAKVPVPNVPGKWKEVIHDKTVTWLANWKENVNGQAKYVFLAAGSSLKGQSDMNKFEKARELKKHVDRIRKDYTRDLTSKVMADRQRATAMYFIDRYALRAGNEKGEEEADTVGCCSLRYEHITMQKPDTLILDFLGKDSIRYYNELKVEPQIFKNIRIFKEGKSEGDDLFDRVTTSILNKHLTSYMKGLTAKVFRTYNASITCQEQLNLLTKEGDSVAEKVLSFNRANRLVAILCNHQRTVSKGHNASMEKMNEKLRHMKYQRQKLRHALLTQEPKLKKREDLKEDESDIDDEWIATHEDDLRKKEIEKVEKKFEKDKEKAIANDEEPLKDDVLQERIAAIDEEYDRLKTERGTGKAELKTAKSTEKLEEALEKIDERIKAFRLQALDKEEGKEVSLTTSKTNYIDPRIIAAWSKKHGVPIEKVLSKSLINKFPWAVEVDEDYVF